MSVLNAVDRMCPYIYIYIYIYIYNVLNTVMVSDIYIGINIDFRSFEKYIFLTATQCCRNVCTSYKC
jgi:hypothetical protein